MKVRFEKISNNHSELRNDVIEGEASCYPMVGQCFEFYGKPLDEAMNFRMVNTSMIVSISEPEENVFILTTRSKSEYKVTVLEAKDE